MNERFVSKTTADINFSTRSSEHFRNKHLESGGLADSCETELFPAFQGLQYFSWMEALVMEELDPSSHVVRLFRHDYHLQLIKKVVY